MQQSSIQPTKAGARQASILSIFICLGAFVFSYNTVCLTQAAELLRIKNNLTKDEFVYQLSIATSCFNLGAFISPILYRKYVSIFGELKGLLIIDIIGIIAISVQMIQLSFYVLAAARLVLGFIIGISTAIIPVYINSIAPPSMVGKLGTFNQLLQTLGVVVAYIAGSMINDDPADEFRWRVYLGFPALFLVLRILGLQLIYRFETLERHLLNGETNEIQRYCQMVYERDDEKVVEYVTYLKSFKKISQQNRSTFRTRFVIALVVIASNQLSGTNSILYYAKQLFNKITDSDVSKSQLLIIVLSLVQVLATFVSSQVVDKVGRKKMILRGQASIAICLFGIVIFDKIVSQFIGTTVGNIGVISLIFIHLMIMNLTLGPCCIIYCTQIVQDITWMIIMLKGLALMVALTSQYMIQYLGIGFMFLIFLGLTLAAHIFLRPRLKQTKGLSTTQVYSSFEKQATTGQVVDKDNQSLLTENVGSRDDLKQDLK